VSFCRNPVPAADRLPGAEPLVANKPLRVGGVVRRDIDLVKSYLDAGGAGELTGRAAGRLRRLAAERWKGRRNG
ncbi:MAG TPA: hypothetical protein VNP92_17220, partial [Actinophytocola sp.]|nr:hypothetical protein [Actinophytocola sp.]